MLSEQVDRLSPLLSSTKVSIFNYVHGSLGSNKKQLLFVVVQLVMENYWTEQTQETMNRTSCHYASLPRPSVETREAYVPHN